MNTSLSPSLREFSIIAANYDKVAGSMSDSALTFAGLVLLNGAKPTSPFRNRFGE